MATLVSTGQITIVDNNDAKPLTAFITSSNGVQQIYTKDESTISWLPDWSSGGVTLTAKVYVGTTSGATDVTGQLTSRYWYSTATDAPGSAITGTSANISTNAFLTANFVSGTFTATHNSGGSTLQILANIKDTVPGCMVYFEGLYTDPSTGLVSKIIASINLSVVKTGTNAVFINVRGGHTIEQSNNSNQATTAIAADLVRSSGIDTSGVTYAFYEAGGATQILNNGTFTPKYGRKSTSGNAPTSSYTEIGTGLGTNTNNTLVIGETAIVDIGVFRVDVTDADSKVYTAFFSVYDVNDPYETIIYSSTGDKLQNGGGTTSLTPYVYNGGDALAGGDYTNWAFRWKIFDKDGRAAGFVDTAKIATAGGAPITTCTTGASAVITYTGTSYAFTAGMLVKVVPPSFSAGAPAAYFYEVASSVANAVTIRAITTNTQFSNNTGNTVYPAATGNPTYFANNGSKLFGCTGTGTADGTNNGTRLTAAQASITVTGDDIDVKGRILVEASKPI